MTESFITTYDWHKGQSQQKTFLNLQPVFREVEITNHNFEVSAETAVIRRKGSHWS